MRGVRLPASQETPSGRHGMDEAPILVDRRDGYRVITLNRPQRLNAFNEAMHGALKAALDEAEADVACRALLLTGAGRGFCAGQDLSDRVTTRRQQARSRRSLETYYNPLVRKLRALPFPVGRRGQRRRRRRRRQYRAQLRHRAGRALGQIHPGFRQARPGPGFGRHMAAAAPGRHGARTRAGAAGRASSPPSRRKTGA